MTEKRFTDDGVEEIVDQSFTDNLTGKTYWIDNGLDDIVDLLNEQHETIKRLEFENFELKTKLNAIKSEFTHREILTIKEFEEVIK